MNVYELVELLAPNPPPPDQRSLSDEEAVLLEKLMRMIAQ